jgi:hypothetical protein
VQRFFFVVGSLAPRRHFFFELQQPRLLRLQQLLLLRQTLLRFTLQTRIAVHERLLGRDCHLPLRHRHLSRLARSETYNIAARRVLQHLQRLQSSARIAA